MKNKIRIINVDSKMPNIALMKISGHHKAKGDDVGYYNALADIDSDILYVSKIFTFTHLPGYMRAGEIVIGGSGVDIKKKLPKDIEKTRHLDYSMWPECNYSMQYFSRGCINNCPFCIVREKEGYIRPVEPLELNPAGKHLEILDNNFFANPEWRKAIEYIKKLDQPARFHGVDVRAITDEQMRILNSLKTRGTINIAWDNPRESLYDKLKLMASIIKPYRIICYVLIGFWSNEEEDLMRIKKISETGISPFVMPYDKSDRYQKDMARWVNNRRIFRSCTWEEYKNLRGAL